MIRKVDLSERIAEIEATSILRSLGFREWKGAFVALTLAEWAAVKELIASRVGPERAQ